VKLDARELASRLSNPRAVARLLGLDKGAVSQPRGLMVLCPAHGDKGPSLSLRAGKDGLLQVRCFGCRLSGDIWTLLQAIERCDFPAALRRASELLGAGYVAPSYEQPPPEIPPLTDEEMHALGSEILEAGRLGVRRQTRSVENYLRSRYLLDAAIAAGWAAMPGLHRWSARLLERAGLLREDRETGEMRECWPAHRLIIPWRRSDGRIDTLQRRLIAPSRRAGTPPYVFLRGRRPREPYGVERLRKGHPVAWVEGAMDAEALELITGGRLCALGLPGVNGWTSTWATYAEGRGMYIATDADEPGERCAAQIAHDCASGPRTWHRCRAEGAKDWAKLWELRCRARER
jgi:DNA primase